MDNKAIPIPHDDDDKEDTESLFEDTDDQDNIADNGSNSQIPHDEAQYNGSIFPPDRRIVHVFQIPDENGEVDPLPPAAGYPDDVIFKVQTLKPVSDYYLTEDKIPKLKTSANVPQVRPSFKPPDFNATDSAINKTTKTLTLDDLLCKFVPRLPKECFPSKPQMVTLDDLIRKGGQRLPEECLRFRPEREYSSSTSQINPIIQSQSQNMNSLFNPCASFSHNVNLESKAEKNVDTPAIRKKADAFASLKRTSDFQALKQELQLHPHLLNAVLASIQMNKPLLNKLISENREEFMEALNEPVEHLRQPTDVETVPNLPFPDLRTTWPFLYDKYHNIMVTEKPVCDSEI